MATVAAPARIERIPLSRNQAIFLGLLVISICLNYIDRGSLSVADRFLQTEFSLDPVHRGMVYSAFFWTYAGSQILAGWLVDRFNVNKVLAGGFMIWSTAMLFTGAASGFLMLFMLRLVLGVGESVAYPSYSKILAGNFRENQRGFANAAIDAGCKIGPGIGILAGGLLMGRYGWRIFFFITGGLSLLWLIPWFIWGPKGQMLLKEETGKAPSIAEICAKRSAWGTFFALFCANYVWYFILTWLPSYFRDELHYSQNQMALFGSIPLFFVSGSSLFFGYLSDRFISNGASPNLVRKSFTGLGLLLSTVMLLAVIVRDPVKSLVLLCAACFFYGIYSSNIWAVTQSLSGPWAAGRWTGLQNLVGNLSGIVAPWLTGYIVQRTGQFYWAFVVTTVLLVLGALCFTVVIDRVEPVAWPDRGIPSRLGGLALFLIASQLIAFVIGFDLISSQGATPVLLLALTADAVMRMTAGIGMLNGRRWAQWLCLAQIVPGLAAAWALGGWMGWGAAAVLGVAPLVAGAVILKERESVVFFDAAAVG
jgi:MFS family permease